jgi:UDP-N-acetylmuramyl pentapeptide synthase
MRIFELEKKSDKYVQIREFGYIRRFESVNIMKTLFKLILKYYLKYITKLVLFVHQPVIIAVTGSTNKAFIKNEIKKLLKEDGKNVRANPKSFNTEIGLPLAILDLSSGYNSYRNWLPVMLAAARAVFQKNYPKYLVIELGVSKKGDMRYLLSLIQPKIVVISDITQRYIEAFSGMDDLTEEYRLLARSITKGGVLILNGDNYRVRKIGESVENITICHFGRNKNSSYWIFDEKRTERGERFKLKYGMMEKEYEIKYFGIHNISAKAASIAVKDYLDGSKN